MFSHFILSSRIPLHLSLHPTPACLLVSPHAAVTSRRVAIAQQRADELTELLQQSQAYLYVGLSVRGMPRSDVHTQPDACHVLTSIIKFSLLDVYSNFTCFNVASSCWASACCTNTVTQAVLLRSAVSVTKNASIYIRMLVHCKQGRLPPKSYGANSRFHLSLPSPFPLSPFFFLTFPLSFPSPFPSFFSLNPLHGCQMVFDVSYAQMHFQIMIIIITVVVDKRRLIKQICFRSLFPQDFR